MISIVIPVYNGENFIIPTIENFKKQLEQDFELIFVNDGSVDNSMDILRQVQSEGILNIKVINQENKGPSAARNAGLKIAEGDYICFCDSDDGIKENYLSEMLNAITKKEVDLALCKYEVVQNNTKNAVPSSNDIIIKDSNSTLRDYLYGNVGIGIWSLMVKKDVLVKNDLWFDENQKYGEDIHMIWRLIACSKNIAYVDKPLYLYFIQDDSLTATFDISKRLKVYQLIKSLIPFMEDRSPQFANEFIKYAAPRIMWSLTWQVAVYFTPNEYKQFITNNSVRDKFKNLITYRSLKVALSASTFLISPSLFRSLAKKFGKKR